MNYSDTAKNVQVVRAFYHRFCYFANLMCFTNLILVR